MSDELQPSLLEASERRTAPAISVVVPAFDEESQVAPEIERLRDALRSSGIDHEIILVDDGSSDRTAERAEGTGALVVRHPQNRGYGAALKTGIRRARHDLIVITDADGTYPPEAIPALLEHAADYDMVVGARTGDDVHIPLVRRPAKWFLQRLASYLAGTKIPDLNSGLRVMKRRVVERFDPILPSGFSFTTTITLAMLCNDYLVRYVPINYQKRVGSSKIRPGHAYDFFLLILRTIVYFNPLKIFLPAGALLFLAGLGKFIYDLYIGNLSESAVLGLVGALLVWAIGLLSDQIARLGIGTRPR
jgi:glycosyltransferase involved in cell wall biosynthesis